MLAEPGARPPGWAACAAAAAEALPLLQELGVPSTFVRMQSTLCEAQAMEKFMLELDANLLMARPAP